MKSITKLLSAALLMGASAVAIAQTAPAPGPAGEPGARPKRERPSADTIQRIQDGKIAGALATLKLTADQQKLWAPVEAKIRERHAERTKMMEAWANRKSGDARPSMSDRMNKMAEMMSKRAENAKAFATVFGPFEASLSEDQKKVIGPVMAELSGGGKRGRMAGHGGGMGGGHRWGQQGGGQPQ
jgi:hypothetical protein